MSIARKMMAVLLIRKAALTLHLARADALFERFDWESFDSSSLSGRQRRDLHAIKDAYLNLIAERELEGCSEALYQCYPWYRISLIEFVSGRAFQAGSMLKILILRIQCLLADLNELSEGDEADEERLFLTKILNDSVRLQARIKESILINCGGSKVIA